MYTLNAKKQAALLHHKILLLRQLKGFTPKYMAAQLKIPAIDYLKIESGQKTKLPGDIIKKLADILGAAPQDLESNCPFVLVKYPDSMCLQADEVNSINKELLMQVQALQNAILSLINVNVKLAEANFKMVEETLRNRAAN